MIFYSDLMQLLLMKRGGQLIYAGPLGMKSVKLIRYFEVSYFWRFANALLMFHSMLDATYVLTFPRPFREFNKYGKDITLQLGFLKLHLQQRRIASVWTLQKFIANQICFGKHSFAS